MGAGTIGGVATVGPVAVDAFSNGKSWCGALQMSGGLLEVCRDVLDYTDYEDGDANPVGDTGGDARTERAVRGGSRYQAFAEGLFATDWRNLIAIQGLSRVTIRPVIELED